MEGPSRSNGDARELLGVRIARNAPLVFVAARGISARPGTRVIVRLESEDGEREAVVAVGAGQLIFAGGIRPAGALLRLA